MGDHMASILAQGGAVLACVCLENAEVTARTELCFDRGNAVDNVYIAARLFTDLARADAQFAAYADRD